MVNKTIPTDLHKIWWKVVTCATKELARFWWLLWPRP